MCLVVACANVGDPNETSLDKVMTNQNQSDFIRMLKAEDWEAIEVARHLGPAATLASAPFVSDPSEDVRFLAVSSVVAGGGPEAPKLLLQALLDEDEQVRATAAQALIRFPPEGQIRQAWEAWDAQDDPTVRYYLGLSLGLTSTDTSRQVLSKLNNLPDDEPESSADALIGALAKRQNAEGRELLAQRIDAATGPRVAALLQVFTYVNDPAILRQLRPLLDKLEVAVDLSSHAHTLHRRSCDLAVDEIARLAPGRLSFQADPMAQYAPEQLAEARALLDAWPDYR